MTSTFGAVYWNAKRERLANTHETGEAFVNKNVDKCVWNERHLLNRFQTCFMPLYVTTCELIMDKPWTYVAGTDVYPMSPYFSIITEYLSFRVKCRSSERWMSLNSHKTRFRSAEVSTRSLLQMMLAINRLCAIRCRYVLQSQKYESAGSSSSHKFNATIKQLMASRQYKQALNAFDRHSTLATDDTLFLALKASAELGDEHRGVRIHQQLSASSLHKPNIQTILVHFYSACSSCSSRRCSFCHLHC